MHPTTSPAELTQQAEARWQQIRTARPDLAPAIDLQRCLVTRIIELGHALGQAEWPSFVKLPGETAAKLGRGVPLLRHESIPFPSALLAEALRDFCRYLAQGGAGKAAEHISQALREGRLDAQSLLGASLARNQRSIRTGATHMGLAPDLVWLVAELAVGPVVHVLQHAHFAAEPVHAAVRSALTSWDRGYCPACGSWPAFAEVLRRARIQRCSFCGAGWQLREARCTYCGQANDDFITTTPTERRPTRYLELCRNCRGYLKVLEMDCATPFALLPIEDLATSNLDVEATAREYARPSLPELGDAEAFPCPPSKDPR